MDLTEDVLLLLDCCGGGVEDCPAAATAAATVATVGEAATLAVATTVGDGATDAGGGSAVFAVVVTDTLAIGTVYVMPVASSVLVIVMTTLVPASPKRGRLNGRCREEAFDNTIKEGMGILRR